MHKYVGDIADPRSQKQKDKDYKSSEVDLGAVVFLTKKEAEKNAKAYIERNQSQKSSCLPSSCANALWKTEGVVLAEEPIYSLRANKPQPGCWWADIADKIIARGMEERALVKEVFTEKEANNIVITPAMVENAKSHRQRVYFWLKPQDIYDLARVINSDISAPFSIFANFPEWSQKVPEVSDTALIVETAPINHAICAIPKTAYKYKDKIGFFVTDSAHFGGYAKREITEDFYRVRMKHGIYFEDLAFETISPKLPFKYEWTRDLYVGCKGDDVLKLQQALQWLGFFPANKKPTGEYWGLTRQAVKDFQEYYKTSVLLVLNLTSGTGYFGKSSMKQMYRLM